MVTFFHFIVFPNDDEERPPTAAVGAPQDVTSRPTTTSSEGKSNKLFFALTVCV